MKFKYEVKGMTEWSSVEADLCITDPPFGIEFDGEAGNYNREEKRVSDGYVEWRKDEYRENIEILIGSLYENTVEDGQALIFSGWNQSDWIHSCLRDSDFIVQGKLYWEYNFAPYCKKRPAHNAYEIFWVTKDEESWYYSNECSYSHCQDGEANLSVIPVKRNYRQGKSKYATQLPPQLIGVLLEHYSEEGDTVFDPLAGSGTVGIVSEDKGRKGVCGDLNENAKEIAEEIRYEYGLTDHSSSARSW